VESSRLVETGEEGTGGWQGGRERKRKREREKGEGERGRERERVT
jgi:hypothetical protein